MKILVLQLARLGDIFQTWPVLSALKRRNPGAELHFVTRAKFAQAAEGIGAIDRHWRLETREILTPLIDEKPALTTSMDKLEGFARELSKEKFDLIINLSFSPFSSFLTQAIADFGAEYGAGSTVDVRGYTRFADGYLQIPDDGSAYFYAQVGVGRANRLHLTDLFAYIAGVELEEADWCRLPQHEEKSDGSIVIHIGASVAGKTLSPSKWQMVVKGLLESWRGEVILIGSPEERPMAAQIEAVRGERKPLNLVGQTSIERLIEVVRDARLLIGGDSGPVQIASLVNTPTLNISFPSVSFWETGPRAQGSRILFVEDEALIAAEEIVVEAIAMMEGRMQRADAIRVPERTKAYQERKASPQEFEWMFLRALYMGEPFPEPPSRLFAKGMRRLFEVNRLALEQVEALGKDHTNTTASHILEQSDLLMDQIVAMVPELSVLLRWFRTERLRIGPMPVADIVAATEKIHTQLDGITSLYLMNDHDNGKVIGEPGL